MWPPARRPRPSLFRLPAKDPQREPDRVTTMPRGATGSWKPPHSASPSGAPKATTPCRSAALALELRFRPTSSVRPPRSALSLPLFRRPASCECLGDDPALPGAGLRLSVQPRPVKPLRVEVVRGRRVRPDHLVAILRQWRRSVTRRAARWAERGALDRRRVGATWCVRAGAYAYLGPRLGLVTGSAT